MTIYLPSYGPLIQTASGAAAVEKYQIPPYVEASCRREPDLEHEHPSISALSRGTGFASRLQVGDMAVYLTVKDLYPGFSAKAWRLTAILEVVERFETHEDAAEWYRERDLPLPSNCIVDGNDPLPLDQTGGFSKPGKISGKRRQVTWVDEWDEAHRERAQEDPVFLVCKALFKELYRPPILTEGNAKEVFGPKGIPNTRTPPALTDAQFEQLKQLCGIRE